MSDPAEDTPSDEAPSPEPDWKGFKLDEMSGVQVGKVEGVIASESGGQADWIIARMGRFGHYCLVPARDAVAANRRVWVPYSRDEIRRAPRIDPSGPPPDDLRDATRRHYGLGEAVAP
jgi:hypothetical protein